MGFGDYFHAATCCCCQYFGYFRLCAWVEVDFWLFDAYGLARFRDEKHDQDRQDLRDTKAYIYDIDKIR